MKQSASDVQTRLDRFLFAYRNTPHTTTGESPAALLRTAVPRTHADLLFPDRRESVRAKQSLQKTNSDEHSKSRVFSPGDDVYVRLEGNQSPWRKGILLAQHGQLADVKIFDIQRTVRRHLDHIKHRHVDLSELNELCAPKDLEVPRQHVEPPVQHTPVTPPVVVPPDPEPVVPGSPVRPAAAAVSQPQPATPVLRRSSRVPRPVDRLNL